MRRIVLHTFLFLLLSILSTEAQTFVVQEDTAEANPFAVIEYIESRIAGNKSVNVDSIKYELVKQYVIDYSNLGQNVAYDSLSKRAMRSMYSHYSGENASSNFGSLDDIENEHTASQGELYRLRRENEELKKRVSRLEHDSKKNGIAVASNAELKRTNAWVQKVVKQTNLTADSITLISLKGNDRLHLPLCLNTLSHSIFKPHFANTLDAANESGITDRIADTSALAKKFRQSNIRRNISDRLLYKVSLLDPSYIAYYDLDEYRPPVFSIRDKHNKYVTVRGYEVEEMDVITPSKRKQKRIDEVWSMKGRVNVSFITYFVSHWSGGGKNTTSFTSNFRLDRNYKKDPIRWNNRLDMDLGFIYYEKDKTHPFRINEDETTISSTYLLQMKKHEKLFFTLPAARVKTHLFTSYDSYNDTTAATSFLTPTNIYLGTGVYYEHNRNMNFSFLPVCGRIFWLISDKLSPEDHGLESGKHASIAPGYMAESEMMWKITRGVSLNNELAFFIPYSPKTFSNDIMLDWKLTGNFTVNRFFSAQLMLKIIFDKRVKSEYREWPQLQQKYSLKFTYAF